MCVCVCVCVCAYSDTGVVQLWDVRRAKAHLFQLDSRRPSTAAAAAARKHATPGNIAAVYAPLLYNTSLTVLHTHLLDAVTNILLCEVSLLGVCLLVFR
jgi:hypothetical protein